MTDTKNNALTGPFWLNDWYVDPDAGRLARQGAEVRLEPRVMSLLLLLANHAGEVMSRESIEAEVWKNMIVGYDALASSMIKLRKALGDNSRQPRYIETVSKKGYRLIAPVHRGSPPHETLATLAPASEQGRRYFLPVLIIGFILLGLLVLSSLVKQDPPTTVLKTAPVQQTTLVILPFTNLSGDPRQEYFSDGITEDLIIDLSRYSGLKVVSQRTTFSYKTRTVAMKTLAEELGVHYVVEGSVRRDGSHIRINVQLTDAHSGINLWAERYDREAAGLFDVQDEVRKKIVNALEITLTEEERHRQQVRYTNSFEAYDYFLRGQAQLVRRASASDNNLAMELMQKATRIDPSFARAHAALALIYADAYRFNWSNDPEHTRQLALDTSQHAIELDSQSPQAFWISGYIYLFLFENHDKAIEMASRSIELQPDSTDAINMLAASYTFGDEPEKARLLIHDIMRKNRHYSAMVPSILALAELRLGHFNKALHAYNQSLLINPSRIQSNVLKVVVLYRMNNIDDASFQVEQLYNLHPDFKLSSWIPRQPFRDKDVLNRIVQDLISAGVTK